MSTNPWKEAATLIIVARASIAQKVGPDLGQNMMIISRVIQATDKPLIKATKEHYKTDYRIMMVKRSNLSSFMASAYVFPGGQVEKSDFSSRWWDVFRKFGIEKQQLINEIRSRISGPRPPVLREPLVLKDKQENGESIVDDLIPEIAFRIAAIRETFEETGVPLLTRPNSKTVDSNKSVDFGVWREKIRNGGSLFLDFCLEMNQCPDIWSLYEWWDWLTPISVGHKRFDTMFYICCLDKQPEVVLDNTEVTTLQWCTPTEMLTEHEKEGVFLAPPQVYELARINNLTNFNSIHEFARKREKHGVERWMPVISTYVDGAISLLPGDDLYPETPDFIGLKPVADYPQNLEEMRSKTLNLNRIELRGPVCSCVCNCKVSCGHLSPVTHSPLMTPVQSML